MFVLERKKPLPLQKIDVITSRLPSSHPKLPELRQRAAKYQKGYNGERKLDYHLKSLREPFSILNDVTFSIFDKLTQIDSLIVSPHAIYIIEVKSIDNEVTFNTNLKQFIQHNGEILTRYKYPITQVETIQFHLTRWLEQYQLAGMPIYYFIAFSEKSTIINIVGKDDHIKNVVAYVEEIPSKIMKLESELEKIHSSNQPLQRNIISTILQKRINFDVDIFEEVNISKSELLNGVHCPECKQLKMKRGYKIWLCNYCGHRSTNAHQKALFDWFTVFNHTMTNRQCRNFLNIHSRHTAKRILQSSNLIRSPQSQNEWKRK